MKKTNDWDKKDHQFWHRISAAIACLRGYSVIFRHNVILHGLPAGVTEEDIEAEFSKPGIVLEIDTTHNKAYLITCNVTTSEYGFDGGSPKLQLRKAS